MSVKQDKQMSTTDNFRELLKCVSKLTYPTLVQDPNDSKKIIERLKQEYDTKILRNYQIPTSYREMMNQKTLMKNNINDIERMIRNKQIAALTEMVDIDYSKMETEEFCSICYRKPKDKRVGWNLINCNGNKENHVLCTWCLLERWQNENTNEKMHDDQKYNILNQECYCQICTKKSQIKYIPPSDRTLLKGERGLKTITVYKTS